MLKLPLSVIPEAACALLGINSRCNSKMHNLNFPAALIVRPLNKQLNHIVLSDSQHPNCSLNNEKQSALLKGNVRSGAEAQISALLLHARAGLIQTA